MTPRAVSDCLGNLNNSLYTYLDDTPNDVAASMFGLPGDAVPLVKHDGNVFGVGDARVCESEVVCPLGRNYQEADENMRRRIGSAPTNG